MLSIAPSDEALIAITNWINGATYDPATQTATYGYEYSPEALEISSAIQVFVLHESEKLLDETLDVYDRTSHQLRVFVTARPADASVGVTGELAKVRSQIMRRLAAFTFDGRVQIWELDEEDSNPDRDVTKQIGLFQETIPLRVEVEASS